MLQVHPLQEFYTPGQTKEPGRKYTWMSQEVSKWLVHGLQPTCNWVYWGYNLLTNLLLVSWDIQVPVPWIRHGFHHYRLWLLSGITSKVQGNDLVGTTEGRIRTNGNDQGIEA